MHKLRALTHTHTGDLVWSTASRTTAVLSLGRSFLTRMKRRLPAFGLLLPVSVALDNGVGLTPAMGWSSWNRFRCAVSESLVREVALAMVSTGLRDAGYKVRATGAEWSICRELTTRAALCSQYVNLDDCWQEERGSDGHIIPNAQRFPSGMKALGDYIHSLGLKFGVYSDTSNVTCEGFPGSRDYEAVDARDYASWGVDFLKYDYCGMEDAQMPTRYYYERMRDALNASGRPIFFSICSWGVGQPHEWGAAVGNSWRTGRDLFAAWDEHHAREVLRLPQLLQSVLTAVEGQANLAQYAGPGGFNDPDMLVVGIDGMSAYGMVNKCPDHLPLGACISAGGAPDKGFMPLPNNTGEYVTREVWGKVGGLTHTEQRSVFSFWCMLSAPLILGNDPRRMRRSTLRILTARELIAINQDPLGQQARRVWSDGPLQIWRKRLTGDRHAVMLFNGGSNVTDITVKWHRDLPEVAQRWLRSVPRDPPCRDTREDCAELFRRPAHCRIDLQNRTHALLKAGCMRTCNACAAARVRKGRYAVALVRNAWENEYEGIFGAQFTATKVEAHEARVYVLRFESQEVTPGALMELMEEEDEVSKRIAGSRGRRRGHATEHSVKPAAAAQHEPVGVASGKGKGLGGTRRHQSNSAEGGRGGKPTGQGRRGGNGAVSSGSVRRHQGGKAAGSKATGGKVTSSGGEPGRRSGSSAPVSMLDKLTGMLTAKLAGCRDSWAVRFPMEIDDRNGRSCSWKSKWGQCAQFAQHCERTCGRCGVTSGSTRRERNHALAERTRPDGG